MCTLRAMTCVLCLTLVLSLASAAGGFAPAPPTGRGGTGDSPPTPFYTWYGHGGVARAVHGNGSLGGPASGTFVLSGLPAGATVHRAFFVTGVWSGSPYTINLTFNGSSYGSIAAHTTDPWGFDLSGFAVDVTADVPGNGSYSYSAVPGGSGSGIFGSLLFVIYDRPTDPAVFVAINVGAENIQSSSSTSAFTVLPVSGPGELHVWVESDDAGTSGTESLAFNGTVVAGGPGADIFNRNQGSSTSYFAIPVSVSSSNTVTLTTGTDWIGWHFAALVAPPEVSATESTTWGRVKALYR